LPRNLQRHLHQGRIQTVSIEKVRVAVNGTVNVDSRWNWRGDSVRYRGAQAEQLQTGGDQYRVSPKVETWPVIIDTDQRQPSYSCSTACGHHWRTFTGAINGGQTFGSKCW